MKVELQVSPSVSAPYAVIYTNSVTAEIRQAIALLEAEQGLLTALDGCKMVVLHSEEVFLVRVEAGEAAIYTREQRYTAKKRLYELAERLGPDFIQIGKGLLVNLQTIDCVEPYFNGMMAVRLKNGLTDYISRKYLPRFKQALGL